MDNSIVEIECSLIKGLFIFICLHFFTFFSLLFQARGLAELTKGTNVTVNSVLAGPTWTEVFFFFSIVFESCHIVIMIRSLFIPSPQFYIFLFQLAISLISPLSLNYLICYQLRELNPTLKHWQKTQRKKSIKFLETIL